MATLVASDPRNIQRVALNHTDDVEANLRGEVLSKAYELFGYAADSFATRGPLAKVLAELGITPLNRVEVDLYKRSKEKEWTQHRRAWAHVAATLSPAVYIGLLFSVKAIFGLHEAANGNFTLIDGLSIGCLVVSVLTLIVGNIVYASDVEDVRYKRSWQTWSLGGNDRYAAYPRYIPVHLLNFAIAIKHAVPSSQFFVEELQLTQMRIPAPLPDPFLVVSLGSESYTIGVWDEREFEAKM